MKTRRIYCLFCAVLLIHSLEASKAVTNSSSDWTDHYSWLGQQVPVNPDTIVVKHYITLTQDLVINAPTVLIVEQNGTICGNYLLDISCGARVKNYGHIYVNAAKIRDGSNYSEFNAKNSIVITACNLPGYGQGFFNVAPNGEVKVWPPVLCKTNDTNWEFGNPSAIRNYFKELGLFVYPFLVNEEPLRISCDQPIGIGLSDLSGKELYKAAGNRNYELDMTAYAPGIYFLRVTEGSQQLTQKIIKN